MTAGPNFPPRVLSSGDSARHRIYKSRTPGRYQNKLKYRRDNKKKRAERARASIQASKHGGGGELEANLTQEEEHGGTNGAKCVGYSKKHHKQAVAVARYMRCTAVIEVRKRHEAHRLGIRPKIHGWV